MKRNEGYALLIMTAMISLLAITVMICAFVLSHEVNKDERYAITRQRMLEVKRSLIGRLADVGGGEGITSCGGFINDYGETDNLIFYDGNNFISVLLDEPDAFADWQYDGGNQFWSGYRVWAADDGSYLKPPPAQPNPAMDFLDGWGCQIEVRFIDDVADNKIEIKSRGDDNLWDADPGADITYYGKDIINVIYWRRDITVNVNNTSVNDITVRLIYPSIGIVQITPASLVSAGANIPVTFNNIPDGLRKIEILEGVTVKQVKMFCLPSGNGTYTLEEIEYSG